MSEKRITLKPQEVAAYLAVLLRMADVQMPVYLAMRCCLAVQELDKSASFLVDQEPGANCVVDVAIPYTTIPFSAVEQLLVTPAQLEVMTKMRIVGDGNEI